MVVHCEDVMVKVCLYPWISWEKPTFAEFQITTIKSIVIHTRKKSFSRYCCELRCFLACELLFLELSKTGWFKMNKMSICICLCINMNNCLYDNIWYVLYIYYNRLSELRDVLMDLRGKHETEQAERRNLEKMMQTK